MLKRLKQILEDAFSVPECFVAEAAQERWEETQPCIYEGAYCESCAGIKDCLDKGMACKGLCDE